MTDQFGLESEELEALAKEYAEQYDTSQLEEMRKMARRMRLADIAKNNDNLEGYGAMFEVIFNLPLLPHAEEWIEQIYTDYKRRGGSVIEAHRDSAKTTVITIGFVVFRIGHEPTKSNLLIQVGDGIAGNNSQAVARIIEFNPGWKMIWPNIVKDETKGFGADGYNVIDTADKDWHTKTAALKDPTFIGLGWNSSKIIGKRPTGIFLIDDIHDEKNTSSEARLRAVRKKLTADIMPTLTKDPSIPKEMQKPFRIVVGTPWVEDDTIEFAKKLRNYSHSKKAVYREVPGPPVDNLTWQRCEPDDRGAWFIPDPEGPDILFDLGFETLGWWKRIEYPVDWSEDFSDDLPELERPVYYPRFSQWIVPNWPEKFNIPYLEEKWSEAGGDIEFYRMYLLDLSRLGERLFTWMPFEADKIDMSWNSYHGVDFAEIIVDADKDNSKRSHFSRCDVLELPTHGAVVVGGFYGRINQSDAEKHITNAQDFPGYVMLTFEADGKGETAFYNMTRRNPDWIGVISKKSGNKGKKIRLEREMQPWLANGVVKISDADTPFLNQLRKELRNAPYSKSYDAADSLYWALDGMPHILRLQKMMNNKGGSRGLGGRNKEDDRQLDPLTGVGNKMRY